MLLASSGAYCGRQKWGGGLTRTRNDGAFAAGNFSFFFYVTPFIFLASRVPRTQCAHASWVLLQTIAKKLKSGCVFYPYDRGTTRSDFFQAKTVLANKYAGVACGGRWRKAWMSGVGEGGYADLLLGLSIQLPMNRARLTSDFQGNFLHDGHVLRYVGLTE